MKIKVKHLNQEPKPTTQHGKIVKHLRKHGRITNVEMIGLYILRGSERMRELRAEGYRISSAYRMAGGVFAYDYYGSPFDVEVKWNK